MKKLTPHQQGIIKRYYENKKELAYQKLSELISSLYLATNYHEQSKLWEQVKTSLANMEVDPKKIAELVKKRDLEELAKLVGEMF